jgi:hypothetical protein
LNVTGATGLLEAIKPCNNTSTPRLTGLSLNVTDAISPLEVIKPYNNTSTL